MQGAVLEFEGAHLVKISVWAKTLRLMTVSKSAQLTRSLMKNGVIGQNVIVKKFIVQEKENVCTNLASESFSILRNVSLKRMKIIVLREFVEEKL